MRPQLSAAMKGNIHHVPYLILSRLLKFNLQEIIANYFFLNSRGELKVDLLSPPNVGFHYELSFFKSGSTAINTEDQGKVKL